MVDSFLAQAASIVWGPWLVALLFGTPLLLNLKAGFTQKHLVKLRVRQLLRPPGSPRASP
jgi:Na+/alanine symporter